MAVRLVLLVLGILELLFPRRVVDFWMRRATKQEVDVDLRQWVYTMARVEGIVILVWLFARPSDEER
jgi:hypothetical protein